MLGPPTLEWNLDTTPEPLIGLSKSRAKKNRRQRAGKRRDKAAEWHFRVRLKERYDIELTDVQYVALNSAPRSNDKTRYVGTTTRDNSWWVVNHEGREILALFDNHRNTLLTCLTMSKLKKALAGHQGTQNYLGLKPMHLHLWQFITPGKAQKSPIKLDKLVDSNPVSATTVTSEASSWRLVTWHFLSSKWQRLMQFFRSITAS